MYSIQTVLCPVDLSPLSTAAVRLAADLSRRVRARLVLEHNLEARPPGYLGVSWMWSQEHEGDERAKRQRHEAEVKRLLASIPGELLPEAKVTRGPVAETVLHLAQTLPCELIVMGTHGSTSPEHRSVTADIVRRAHCPVLTIGEGYTPQGGRGLLSPGAAEEARVLVPVDFSDRARRAVAFGIGLTEAMPHRLVLLHVANEDQSVADRAQLYDELRTWIPEAKADRISVDVRAGDPVREILDAARESEALFVLMAAYGKRPWRRLVAGSTTQGVLGRGRCPVLFLPPAFSVAWSAPASGENR